MKRTILILAVILNATIAFSQTEIAKRVFLFKDPSIENVKANTILLYHVDAKLNKEYTEILEKRGFKVIKYFDLFPPIKEYTIEEVTKKLENVKYDIFMVIDLKSIDERSYSTGSGSLVTPNIGVYSSVQNSYVREVVMSIKIGNSALEEPILIVESTSIGRLTTSNLRRVSNRALEDGIDALINKKILRK